MSAPIDDELARGIGAEATEVLGDYAALHGRSYAWVKWLVNGRSQAPVAIVLERDARKARTRRLVLKVPAVDGADPVETEYARHAAAVREAPPAFVGHLTVPEPDPLRIARGRWITLQSVAGDDSESVEVLTTMLNDLLGVDRDGRLERTPADFAAACGAVVAGVLGTWGGLPHTAPEPWTVAEFLRRHIHDQLSPGDRLHTLSNRWPGTTVELHGEPGPLTNPFALARGDVARGAEVVHAIVGPAHGDLHTDNVLVRMGPRADPGDFHLIDLALYDSAGPLTRDPVHLLLYILARRMDTLAAPAQRELIKVLLHPADAPRTQLPTWLSALIDAVEGAAGAWLAGSALHPEWRRQRLLSLAGCAMLFLGRRSTRAEDHEWFLRLAAHAAEEFLRLTPEALVPSGPPDGTDGAVVAPVRLPWRRVPDAASVTLLSDLSPVTAARLWVQLQPVGDTRGPEDRRLLGIHGELTRAGLDCGLFADGEELDTTSPARVLSASGSGLATARDGRCAAWTVLPQDALGGVLDPDDLATRCAMLLAAAIRLWTPVGGDVALGVGIDPRDPLSEGRVADLPRNGPRGWSTRTPVAVPAEDCLPEATLRVPRARTEAGAELAARLLTAFRAGDGTAPR